jgi:internalin A
MSRRFNRIFVSLLSLCMLLTMLFTVNIGAAAATSISVNVNGKTVQFSQAPIIKDGRTLVPLRAILESLGATVNWDQATQTVKATTTSGVTIMLTIGNSVASVGNTTIGTAYANLDVAPQVINGSTLVPVRFIGESTGADVSWDGTTSTVSVTSNSDRYFGTDSATNYEYVGYLSRSGEYRDGYGCTTYSDGDQYIGDYKKDSMCYGSIIETDGTTYVGDVADGSPEGYGKITYSTGAYYVGCVSDGYPNGNGEYHKSNGTVFYGTFDNGSMNGYGEYYATDGSYFKGNFTDGVANGYGTYYHADGSAHSGYWDDGTLSN